MLFERARARGTHDSGNGDGSIGQAFGVEETVHRTKIFDGILNHGTEDPRLTQSAFNVVLYRGLEAYVALTATLSSQRYQSSFNSKQSTQSQARTNVATGNNSQQPQTANNGADEEEPNADDGFTLRGTYPFQLALEIIGCYGAASHGEKCRNQ